MPVNPLKILKAAQAAGTADRERRVLQGLYRGYAADAADARSIEELFASPQRAVAEQYAAKRAAQTGQKPRVEMLMVDPNAGRKYGHSTMGTGSRAPLTTQARKLSPDEVVERSELEYRPDLPVMYHGGTYRRGDIVNQPLYLADDPEFAQSYVDFKDYPGARVLALKPEIYRTAPEKRFNELAKRYVPQNDEYGYTPATALDPSMHDSNRVADLINALWDDEWDSAKAFDLGMGGNGAKQGVVTIMLPGTKAYAKGGSVKADSKSEVERLLAKYPSPRDPRYAAQTSGPEGGELRAQQPETYGFLGGLAGTAPDEFEGSAMDPLMARIRAGAEPGYAAGAALNVAPMIGGIGKLVAKYAPVAARNASMPSTLSRQAGVVKLPGGNWLSGSVEDSLSGLKRGPLDGGKTLIEKGLTTPELMAANPDVALNAWIDKQLTRYVKNDMATEGDPIRALAERGVTHVPGGQLERGADATVGGLAERRAANGFPATGVGKSPTARGWETAADNRIEAMAAGDIIGPNSRIYADEISRNPWLAKVPPGTPVNEAYGLQSEDLGFKHMIDELRNATDPDSGLPPELLLKYSSLNQVSVPQAVERVAKINEWRAAQKAEADLARANNAATVLHKDYPDKGFRWVELKQPDSAEFVGNFEEPPGYKVLQDALKYEGDTMGHCVGGYCDEVASGDARIFSLRDAKGQPHVTIETRPRVEDFNSRWLRHAENLEREAGRGLNDAEAAQELRRFMKSENVAGKPSIQAPPNIIQIKGKGNRKPNDEYLPYVQDFVKSGKWSDVGDLENTGLKSRNRMFDKQALARPEVSSLPEYFTPEELEAAQQSYARELKKPEGFAAGGSVQAPNTYDPNRVNSIVEQFMAEMAQ